MRIAHVITRLILGGAQENTVLCCQDLRADYGDEVILITGPSRGPEGDISSEARRRGIRLVVEDHLRRRIAPWHDVRALSRLRHLLHEFRPDVVHTHSAKGGMLGRLAAWSLHVPAVIHTVHGAPFYQHQGRGGRWFCQQCERFAARRCHAFISVSDAMTELMVEAGIASRDKFTTIYSGMELEPFLRAEGHREVARSRWQFAPDDFVVGKVARMFHLKGHCYLIDAARVAVRQNPRLRFLLVGDGILRRTLMRQIEAAGLSESFRFTGRLPPSEIPQALSAMDLVVHTSLREGLARVLPQALLAGRTVISFDIHGAREVIQHGQTGLLLSAGDTTGLARAIVQLAAAPAQCRQMATRGRDLCQARFCHHSMTAQIRQVYERCLHRARIESHQVTRSVVTPGGASRPGVGKKGSIP